MSVSPSTDSVSRVTAALAGFRLDCPITTFPAGTRTAVEAATALGCSVAEIVKSLVFRGADDAPVLVLASGINRVDEDQVADALGTRLGKADAAFVRRHTGFVIGGVAPIGHLSPLTPVIDEDLLRYPQVWAAAGSPHTVFAIAPADLVRVTGGRVMTVRQR